MQSTLADKNINQSNTAFTSCKIHADLCRALISQSGIKILQYLRIHLTYLSSVMIVLSPLLTDLEMCHASVEVTPHQLGLVSRLLKSSQVDTDNLTRHSLQTGPLLPVKSCGVGRREEGGRDGSVAWELELLQLITHCSDWCDPKHTKTGAAEIRRHRKFWSSFSSFFCSSDQRGKILSFWYSMICKCMKIWRFYKFKFIISTIYCTYSS